MMAFGVVVLGTGVLGMMAFGGEEGLSRS